jgi:hypothetical protein
MKHLAFIALLLISLPLAAKKAPKWKSKSFKTTASGLQYKIVNPGKGAPIHDTDFVLVELSQYIKKDKSIVPGPAKNSTELAGIYLSDKAKILPFMVEGILLLKKGGRGFFIIPGTKFIKDTLYCYIYVKEVLSGRVTVTGLTTNAPPKDSVATDSVNFKVADPNKKYFGDTLLALMKLVEQPQIVSCGIAKVLVAFKFETTYFDKGVQRKSILVFVECPDAYGKDYFIAGKDYMVTCIPLMDDLKDGKRTMNSYSLQKLESYYGLRISRMGN